MKSDWRKFVTRKDRIEQIALLCANLSFCDRARAWKHLITLMLEMTHPEAPPVPKFNALLLAILRAKVRARVRAERE